jgi:hypothetical protein
MSVQTEAATSLRLCPSNRGVCSGEFCWSAALKAGRSRVRFPNGHWKFSMTYFVRPHYGLGIDSADNRRVPGIFLERKDGRYFGLTAFLFLCAHYREILVASISWSFKSLSRFVMEIASKNLLTLLSKQIWKELLHRISWKLNKWFGRWH